MAQFNLGFMFYRGEGVSQDRVQAYAWINIAVVQGNLDAHRNFRNFIANSMTFDEITRAQKLSDDLRQAFGLDGRTK